MRAFKGSFDVISQSSSAFLRDIWMYLSSFNSGLFQIVLDVRAGYLNSGDACLEQRVLQLQFLFSHGERIGISKALQIFVEGIKRWMKLSRWHHHPSFSELQPVGFGREEVHF